MQFFIDSLALQRLVDPKLEIRQRALAEIKSILVNNIFFEAQRRNNPLADNELRIVNLAELTKQLIRWFQFKQITDQNEVFDLLIMIFSRRDFLRHITQTISIERLKKEIVKIKKKLIPVESASRLEKIDTLLADFEHDLLVDVGHDVESFQDVDGNPSAKTSRMAAATDNVMDRFNRMRLSNASSTSSKCDEDEDAFHEYWINLEGGDLEIFNSLDAELINYKQPEQLTSVIKYIQATIADFPPEFYLQPPNILETLIDILPHVSSAHATDIIRIINIMINGLKDRDKEARRNHASYIPVKKHMNKILQMLTNFFERFHDNFDATAVQRQQEIVNAIHLVLFDLADFIKDTQNVCDIYLNEMMNMIAKVIKDFRVAYENAKENAMIYRLNYIIEIYAINALVSVIDVENITSYCTNNAWEFECDLALLDWPLRTHHNIYNLIKRNRKDIIEEDSDMKMLLYDIKKSWTSFATVFKKWDTMSSEDIIANGLACIDTLRIHKSIEFVGILFEAVNKCSHLFNVNEHLRETAGKIILRLLSIEVPELREKAYQLARDNVQRKLSEDQEEKLKEMDLCYVIGIPVSVEIVTEIICFGYTDPNEEIHKHSKLVLFALLRSKIVFPNHWSPLLDIIKPILPLLSGLFRNDHKLGFFGFDIFHEHSGFDKHELCLAFARFLFCSHAKAREMAKIKLIENLFENNEYANDFIEIIPESFCILLHEQVKDLELLDRNIGYDDDAYQNIRTVLKSYKHNDITVIKTVLLQLNSLMNSLKFAKQSHDDNLWIYFMLTLDMGFPKNSDVRRLVISILYKWAVAVTSFRIYLANETSVLKFLIQSLIYCQEDPTIKKLSSTLLFLLVFSDFVVVTDASISLPQFIKTLECPFKFQEHWDRSPFNQVSQLELLYEAIKEKSEHVDVQETTMKYLRFTFAEVWFGMSKTIYNEKISNERYYKECGKKTLKLPQELLLTETDNKLVLDTSFDSVVRNSCKQLTNVHTLGQVHRAIQCVIAILMLPNESAWKIAEKLENVIKIFSEYAEKRGESQKGVLAECLELYGTITPWLPDKIIADTFGRKTFFEVFNKSIMFSEDNVYSQMLQLINCVVSMCKDRPNLSEMLSFSFNINHKLHFASNLIEKLYVHLTDIVLKDKSWIDVTKIPFVRVIFTLMNNILRTMPILLDETYMNTVFHTLLHATRSFLKSKSKEKQSHLNSQILNQILATVEALTSLDYKYKLTQEDYLIINLWLAENVKSNRAILWSIIGSLTREKESFMEFCKGFESALNFTLNDLIHQTIDNLNSNQIHEQKALALVIGNFIDYAPTSKTLDVKGNRSEHVTLSKIFLHQKFISPDALAFVLKKMIRSNPEEVMGVIKRRKFIQTFMYDVENLDVVSVCYKAQELREHVSNVASSMSEEHLVRLVLQMQHSVHDSLKLHEAKLINYRVLNIILILMKTKDGLEKLLKILRYTSILENLMLVVFEGLKVTNNSIEIIFHLDLVNALINCCCTHDRNDSLPTNIFSQEYGFKMRDSNYFPKIVRDVEGGSNEKAYTIYEKSVRKVIYPIDLLFLQALHIFNTCDSLNSSSDHKQTIRASSFLFVKTTLENYDHVKDFASQINVIGTIVEKTIRFTASIQDNPHTEMSKKNGVQQCQQIIKRFCFFLKAITEWPISLESEGVAIDLKSLFYAVIIVHNWLVSESYLLNCFLNFVQMLSYTKDAKKCIMQEVNGTPLIKEILKRSHSIAVKPPHTPASLMILRNSIKTIKMYCGLVEVRVMLKGAKIFQTLDLLYPQLQSRKTTWNDVVVIWLEFFEFFSRYEDTECSPGQISLLCRFVRMGNSQMKAHSLKIIRNYSLKSSIGYVIVMSDEFIETIDSILSEHESYTEKLIILQTLLGIISRSEQSVAKIKNSALNRKLKNHISNIREAAHAADTAEVNQIYNLSLMLTHALYGS